MEEVADRTEWARLLDRLSREHEGELVTIELLDQTYGDQYEAEHLPFTSALYDRKDDAVVVSVGGRSGRYPVLLRHIISHPTEVSASRSRAGDAFRVVEADGTATLVSFFPATP